jgi:hypothetical protein
MLGDFAGSGETVNIFFTLELMGISFLIPEFSPYE